MLNEEIQEMMRETWTFTHTDIEGTTSTRTFQSSTWPFALQQFLNFLKQDFALDDESVAINGDKHLTMCTDEVDTGWYGAMFYPDSEKLFPIYGIDNDLQ
jgi:hypothetical protein